MRRAVAESRDVALQQVRLHAGLADVGGDGLGGVAARVVVDGDVAAGGGEGARDSRADPGGGPGDEDALGFEVGCDE